MMSARFLGFAVGSLLFGASLTAQAEPMDLALERLVANGGSCLSADGTGRFEPTSAQDCRPDNVAFKRLVNQLGFALAPSAMHAARTTGFGGFNVAFEASYTTLASDADYWKRGTQGAVDPSTKQAATSNQSPASVLQQYAVKLRKGFGYGLEITGVVGFLPQSSLINGGADVRLALLEGFRTGVLGILPDVAVGSGVRTITGTPQLQLTTVGLDVQISKPLVIADTSVLTPWLGYQYLWIFGDSGLIDLTPGTSAQGACNYAGQNVPGNPDPAKTHTNPDGSVSYVYDGQQVCRGGSPRDFNNNVVFEPVRVHRQRLLFGLNYRYEMLLAGAQVITDLLSPSDANSGQNKSELQGEPRQSTFVLELGAMF
ncbi:MAG TPA: hypothetical protein VER11_20395 [Polyangiaceae bacterium]|nr:hypothetical protein [Polyangiaceae bacterium]